MQIGSIINHKYRIVDQIGEGGMSVVFKAEDLYNGRELAVKVLRRENVDDMDSLRRFVKEAKAVRSLNHRNIVRAFEVGDHDGLPFIVMEYVPGMTLKERIRQDGPFAQEEAVGIACQVLTALSYAHRKGLIHRDVNPRNIIISDTGEVKLTDFGIAADYSPAKESDSKGPGYAEGDRQIFGSPHYISPEQFEGKAPDIRSDLYAMAVTLYEMLTGNVPFDADTPEATARLHTTREPVSPCAVNSSISPSMGAVVLKGMSKLPEHRFKSASVMQMALIHALQDPDWSLTVESVHTITNEARIKDLEQDFIHINGFVAIPLLLLTVGLIWLFSSAKANDGRRSVTVPELVGLSCSDADLLADDTGLTMTVEYTLSPDALPDVVLSQDPLPGEVVSPDTNISVIVNGAAYSCAVPNLNGYSYEDAEALLGEHGLIVGRITYRTETMLLGCICDQSPIPGAEVTPGSAVDIVIAAAAAEEAP